ncbi:MAG: VWA domain-containing protein [Candidatus Acidiferrales bacterium]
MQRATHLLLSGFLLLVVSAAVMRARGEQAPAQSAPPKQDATQKSTPQNVSSKQSQAQQNANPSATTPRIRTQVNEVTTPVTVVDKKGNFLLGIPEKDFHVFDNGVEQHIDHWGLDDHPLALAMVIETSSHVGMMAREIRSNGIVVTETLMAQSGKAAVITAGDTVEVRQPFTSDHDAVEKAIQRLRFAADRMHLYDAMFEGTLLLEKQPDTCHRVLVVIAEAQDDGSQFKLGDVLTMAQRENITIYTVGLSSTAADLRSDPVQDAEIEEDKEERIPSVTQAPTAAPGAVKGVGGGMDLLSVAVFLVQRFTHIRNSHEMGAAVAFTGGDYYHPFKDRNIQIALSHIADELHSQYILSYQLQGPAQPGIHEIEVRVSRPHVVVRARLGYYVLPPLPPTT